MKLHIKNRFTIPVIISFFGLAALMIAFFFIAGKYNYENEAIKHQYEILQLKDNIMISVYNIETSSRGFIISGDESFLEPIDKAIVIINQSFDKLRSLSIIDPGRLKRIDSLEELVYKRVEFTQQNIDVRKKEGFLAVQERVKSGEAKELTNTIRLINDEISSEAEFLYSVKKKANEEKIQIFESVFISILLLIVIVFVLIMFFIVKNQIARKKAEKGLKQSEEKFRELVESLPQLVWTCIVEGPCDYLSKQWINYTGIPEEQQLGYGWLDQLHPDDREKTIAEWSEKVESGDSFDIEFRIRRFDGVYRWFKTKAIPLRDSKGNIVKWFGSNTDFDDVKTAEDELKSVLRNLERSNEELEQFAYVASHDLQEPLRMVSSFTQLLQKRYKDHLDQDANEFIQYAVDGADRMQKLINDLLDFSRITTKWVKFEKVDSNIVLGKAISNLYDFIQETDAVITNDVLPGVYGDEAQLIRVFQNLISNAIKFRKTDESPKIHIACIENEEHYIFSVCDNGIGIDMQYQDKVFTIFQRLHAKDKYPGTGIGLSICKRIIERHNGRIWFESNEKEGAVFYFTIPK